MTEANKKLERSTMSQLEILQKVKEGMCSEACDGAWLNCAKEVLQWNAIPRQTFAVAVTNLPEN